MKLIKDFIYIFDGLWESPGQCRIRVFRDEKSAIVIICSDTNQNLGGSITLLAEELAFDLWQTEGNPQNFIWIEHIPGEVSVSGVETFHKVSFIKLSKGKFLNPQWEEMTKTEVEVLVSQLV